MRQRTRAGLVAWTGLGAGAVMAGAILGLPVQNVGGTTHTCQGRTATIVGVPGDDVLIGTPRRDVIAGLGGDDTIEGRGGPDLICGGYGDDRLVGGPGHDRLAGGRGTDQVVGGSSPRPFGSPRRGPSQVRTWARVAPEPGRHT